MLLSSNYVIGHEVCKYHNISISSLSMYRREREDAEDFTSIIKMNGETLINLDSEQLPNGLRVPHEDRTSDNFTDIRNMLPLSYLTSHHELKERDLKKIGGFCTTINGAKYWAFEEDFVKRVTRKGKNTITYILSDSETQDCLRKKQIVDYIHLDHETPKRESRNLVWYFVKGFVSPNYCEMSEVLSDLDY